MRLNLSLLILLALATSALCQPEPDPAPRKEGNPYWMPALGEFWYGMYDPEGNAQGYTRIKFSQTKQEGLHCDWDLHITYDGGNYEEERKITFDDKWRLTYTEMESGESRILAAREGNVMVGKQGIDDLRVEVTDDAVTGMAFVLAACTGLKKGVEFSRTEYNEANGLKDVGKTTFIVGEEEELELPAGKVSAWKITMKRGTGRELPIWVNAEREIVQVDWGTNNLMKLHRESTAHLFKPQPPVLDQLEPEDKTKLLLQGDFAGYTLDEMWKKWATAEGITTWWPPLAEIEGKVGGKVLLTWKTEAGEIQWQLTGKVEVWEPNKKFGFTWRWNETPAETPDLHVVVEFSEVEGGVRVLIMHSKFDPLNDDQQNRTSLKQGWEFFCAKLKK